MLVLSRNRGEQIVIGDDIVIEVKGIRGNIVYLDVMAPRGVKILRAELLDREPFRRDVSENGGKA